MKLDKFDIKDLDYCVESNVRTFSLEPWNDPKDNHDKVRTLIINHMNNNYHLSYVLKNKTELVGFCIGFKKPWIEGFEYYIDQFWIDEKHQNKGYGSHFINLISDVLKEESCNAIILNTEQETPAQQFYAKNGFKDLKEILTFAKDVK